MIDKSKTLQNFKVLVKRTEVAYLRVAAENEKGAIDQIGQILLEGSHLIDFENPVCSVQFAMLSKICIVCPEGRTEQLLCSGCEEEGWWVDPAGGVHSPEEPVEDMAKQYE